MIHWLALLQHDTGQVSAISCVLASIVMVILTNNGQFGDVRVGFDNLLPAMIAMFPFWFVAVIACVAVVMVVSFICDAIDTTE